MSFIPTAPQAAPLPNSGCTRRDRDGDDRRQGPPGREGHEPARGVQRRGRERAVLLLSRRPLVAGRVPAVPRRRQGPAQARAVLLHARRRQDGGHDGVAEDPRRPSPDARVHAREPPHRLPDLRQGGRCACCRSTTSIGTASSRATTASRSRRPRSSTSGRRSSSIKSAASCARAASACATRSRACTSSRWPSAVTTRCSRRRPATSSTTPTRFNTVDVCPWEPSRRRTSASRCAPVSSTRRRPCARAARRAATPTSTRRADRCTASSRASTRRSTSTGCATKAA